MRHFVLCSLLVVCAAWSRAQVDSLIIPEPRTLDLPSLISEALERNPTIRAAEEEMNAMDESVPMAGSLDPPELTYMREDMPNFRFSEARFTRLELMQMFRFPTKLSTERSLAEVRAEHAHHEHLEAINDVIAALAGAYIELWNVQQQFVLQTENARLMRQVAEISGTRYAAGIVPQYDVLKAQTEVAMIQNSLVSLRQKERAAKEMLMTLLNRDRADTLGFAIISEQIPDLLSLDSLERVARSQRPMLIHDSLRVDEARTMLSLSRQGYLPDFRVGVEYMTMPLDNMTGWSLKLGVTLPFVPWTLGARKAEASESEARVRKSAAAFEATRNMVMSELRTRYREAESEKQQLSTFQDALIPQSEQTLAAVMSAYSTGQAELMMVLDSYRTANAVTLEYFMSRMKYEQSLIAIERAVGVRAVAEITDKEVEP